MPYFNKTILMGHLVRDIEITVTGSNLAIGKSSLAVTSKYKNEAKTMFIDFVCFGKTAEVLDSYAKKGDCIMIEGRLTQNTWEDPATKQKRSKHEILVDTVQFVKTKKQADVSQESSGDNSHDDDDDIPF